jgi:hypothetical protein
MLHLCDKNKADFQLPLAAEKSTESPVCCCTHALFMVALCDTCTCGLWSRRAFSRRCVLAVLSAGQTGDRDTSSSIILLAIAASRLSLYFLPFQKSSAIS